MQRAEAAAGSGEHPAAAAVVAVAVSATAAATAGAASTSASAAATADPAPAAAAAAAAPAPAVTAAAAAAEALRQFTFLLFSLFFALFGSGSVMVVNHLAGDNKALAAAVFVSFVIVFCILSLKLPTKMLEVFIDIWATSKLKFFLLSSTITAMFSAVIFNLKMWTFGKGAFPVAVGVGLANLVSRP